MDRLLFTRKTGTTLALTLPVPGSNTSKRPDKGSSPALARVRQAEVIAGSVNQGERRGLGNEAHPCAKDQRLLGTGRRVLDRGDRNSSSVQLRARTRR